MSGNPLLEVEGVETYYGSSQALFGLTFTIADGECISLLGRNGMGKSTTVKSIMGLLTPRRGHVRFRGRAIQGQPSYVIARRGLALVPEGREIFPTLTVRENLVATAAKRAHHATQWTMESVYAMFPRLRERERILGSQLSGGEQQMLAIGRALMTNPDLLILDEATEGLAPMVRHEIWNCLARLKQEGLSLLVIDKNLGPMLRLADRHHVVDGGRVIWEGRSDELRNNPEILQRHLGI